MFGHALTNVAGCFLDVDKGFCALLRQDRERIVGRNFRELTAPADREGHAAQMRRLLRDEVPFQVRNRYIRGDRSLVLVESQVSLFRDQVGRARVIATVTAVPPPSRSPAPRALLDAARFLLRSRRLRERAFESQLFTDPAWDVLLSLYVSEAEGRVLTTVALCETARVRPSVGVRWIRHLLDTDVLEEEGGESADLAEATLRLSAAGHLRFERYLATLVSGQGGGGIDGDA